MHTLQIKKQRPRAMLEKHHGFSLDREYNELKRNHPESQNFGMFERDSKDEQKSLEHFIIEKRWALPL